MCVIDRDNQVVVTDRSREIASLQAEIRKTEQFKFEVAEIIRRPKNCSMKGILMYLKETIDFLEGEYEKSASKDARIKDLEQQLAEQRAYIGRLETAYLADLEAICDGLCDDPEKTAKDAFKKLKTG